MGDHREELEKFLNGKESKTGERIFSDWYNSFKTEPKGLKYSKDLQRELDKIKGVQHEKLFLQSFWRLAAVLLLIAVASGFLYLERGEIQAWLFPEVWKEVVVPAGKRYNITLSDGTEVWLNAHSVFSYPKEFNQRNRQVRLRGEGYFEVKRDEQHPFIVTSGVLTTQVLGTSFVIKAYPDVPEEVVVVSGKVSVSRTLNNHAESVLLFPSMRAIAHSNQSLRVESEIKTSAYTQWVRGKFEFDDMVLTDILDQLGHYYGVKIHLENPAIGACRIQATFDAVSLEKVLTVLAATLQGTYSKTQDGYLLTGAACQ